MIEMGIVDPLRVARSALQNGAAVAGPLLTANTLVAEKQTPWGGSPALMTEFGPLDEGLPPACAGLRHAAVTRPRPLGRLRSRLWYRMLAPSPGTPFPATGQPPGNRFPALIRRCWLRPRLVARARVTRAGSGWTAHRRDRAAGQ